MALLGHSGRLGGVEHFMTDVTTRLIAHGDFSALTALAVSNREFLAPWSPAAPDHAFTEAGQAEIVADALARHEQGLMLPHVMVDSDGTVLGRINLNGITRGAAQSASVGYWVTQARNGRGVATRALRDIVRVAFADLGLHRIQGETLIGNVASQRVLAKVGFTPVGMAPKFLRIAGQWQDHLLFQVVNDGWTDEPADGAGVTT